MLKIVNVCTFNQSLNVSLPEESNVLEDYGRDVKAMEEVLFERNYRLVCSTLSFLILTCRKANFDQRLLSEKETLVL